MTPNQIVAHNLWKARNAVGATQTEAAERFSLLTGSHTSKAVWSFMESGRKPDAPRVKTFDADDLTALSVMFGFPVAWFLVPPSEAVKSTFAGQSLIGALRLATRSDRRVSSAWRTSIGVGEAVSFLLDAPEPFLRNELLSVVVDINAEPLDFIGLPTDVHPIWTDLGVFIGYTHEAPRGGKPADGAVVHGPDGTPIGKIHKGTIDYAAEVTE